MQIEKNIAATLQRKMKAAGKTKLEFSRELGIPRSTFQEYLKGEKCLRSDSIEELAKSLSSGTADLRTGLHGILQNIQHGHPARRAPDAPPSGTGPGAGGRFAFADRVPAFGRMGQA